MKSYKILMIGNGGREASMLIKLHEQHEELDLYQWKSSNVLDFVRDFASDINNYDNLIKEIVKEHFDLVIIGPEKPIIDGVSDQLRALGIDVFAPSQEAAQLEGSKAYAKEFMIENNIPTAKYFVVNSYDEGIKKLDDLIYPVYVKASGLAGGKGAIKCENKEEAQTALKELLVDFKYGKQDKVVIEDYLKGKEVSMLALLIGEKYFLFPPTRDYKKALTGNVGKNTGGMGAISPLDDINKDDYEQWGEEIFPKVISGLKNRGVTYNGILYAGLMIVDNAPYVLEFNCRFGDPETQVLMQLLNSDLLEMMMKAAQGDNDLHLDFVDEYAMTVVLTAKGYPEKYEKFIPLEGYELYKNEILIIPANMKKINNTFISTGGRILNVTGKNRDKKELESKIYNVIREFNKDYFYFREDIGKLYED